MLNCIIIGTCWLSCIANFILAMQLPGQVILTHKKRSADQLYSFIPSSLSSRPLVQLTALLEQTDTFSCVYRSLFHAQCISIAMEKKRQGQSFEKNLKLLLQDENLLNKTYGHVKDYLNQYDPTHNRTTGLCIKHLLGVCAASIPLLHTKILPVLLENDQKIYAVRDPIAHPPSPLHYSADFIRNYGVHPYLHAKCLVELDNSAQLAYQLNQLNGSHRVAHFACRFPNHLFIASIITDKQGYAKLYMIDSNNNYLSDHTSILALTSKILEHVEEYNKKQSDKKTRNPQQNA